MAWLAWSFVVVCIGVWAWKMFFKFLDFITARRWPSFIEFIERSWLVTLLAVGIIVVWLLLRSILDLRLE